MKATEVAPTEAADLQCFVPQQATGGLTGHDPAGTNGNVCVTIYPMSYQVKQLLLPNGSSPYAEWFAALDPMAAAKVSVAAARMEQGNLSNVEWFRGIGEYKIDWGPGYRIYLAKDGLKIIVLLGGGSKKRQQKDIDEAVALWEDYKRRKAQTKKGA